MHANSIPFSLFVTKSSAVPSIHSPAGLWPPAPPPAVGLGRGAPAPRAAPAGRGGRWLARRDLAQDGGHLRPELSRPWPAPREELVGGRGACELVALLPLLMGRGDPASCPSLAWGAPRVPEGERRVTSSWSTGSSGSQPLALPWSPAPAHGSGARGALSPRDHSGVGAGTQEDAKCPTEAQFPWPQSQASQGPLPDHCPHSRPCALAHSLIHQLPRAAPDRGAWGARGLRGRRPLTPRPLLRSEFPEQQHRCMGSVAADQASVSRGWGTLPTPGAPQRAGSELLLGPQRPPPPPTPGLPHGPVQWRLRPDSPGGDVPPRAAGRIRRGRRN